ncbi:hypothetical protein [Nocardia sp. IFM 10818]
MNPLANLLRYFNSAGSQRPLVAHVDHPRTGPDALTNPWHYFRFNSSRHLQYLRADYARHHALLRDADRTPRHHLRTRRRLHGAADAIAQRWSHHASLASTWTTLVDVVAHWEREPAAALRRFDTMLDDHIRGGNQDSAEQIDTWLQACELTGHGSAWVVLDTIHRQRPRGTPRWGGDLDDCERSLWWDFEAFDQLRDCARYAASGHDRTVLLERAQHFARPWETHPEPSARAAWRDLIAAFDDWLHRPIQTALRHDATPYFKTTSFFPEPSEMTALQWRLHNRIRDYLRLPPHPSRQQDLDYVDDFVQVTARTSIREFTARPAPTPRPRHRPAKTPGDWAALLARIDADLDDVVASHHSADRNGNSHA